MSILGPEVHNLLIVNSNAHPVVPLVKRMRRYSAKRRKRDEEGHPVDKIFFTTRGQSTNSEAKKGGEKNNVGEKSEKDDVGAKPANAREFERKREKTDKEKLAVRAQRKRFWSFLHVNFSPFGEL